MNGFWKNLTDFFTYKIAPNFILHKKKKCVSNSCTSHFDWFFCVTFNNATCHTHVTQVFFKNDHMCNSHTPKLKEKWWKIELHQSLIKRITAHTIFLIIYFNQHFIFLISFLIKFFRHVKCVFHLIFFLLLCAIFWWVISRSFIKIIYTLAITSFFIG